MILFATVTWIFTKTGRDNAGEGSMELEDKMKTPISKT